MNTTEKNRIIAEFMGWEFIDRVETIEGIFKRIKQWEHPAKMVLGWFDTQFDYHSDWNLLMPVVEKIHTITSEHDQQFARMVIFELGIATPINDVYSACVQFIQWYTTKQKEAGDE